VVVKAERNGIVVATAVLACGSFRSLWNILPKTNSNQGRNWFHTEIADFQKTMRLLRNKDLDIQNFVKIRYKSDNRRHIY